MLFFFISLINAFRLEMSKYVTELNNENWNKTIEERDPNTIWFVMFYGNYCPACHQTSPAFNFAARNLYGYVKFGASDTDRCYEPAMRYLVKYLPTMIIFHSEGFDFYNGPRSPESMIEGISPFYSGCLQPFDPEFQSKGKNTAILFSSKNSAPFQWKLLSCKIKDIATLSYSNNPEWKIKFNVFGSSGLVMQNSTTTVTLKNMKNFTKDVLSFFNGKYHEELLPHPLYLPYEFKSECNRPSKLCVCFNYDRIDANFVKKLTKFSGKPVKFFQGDGEWAHEIISKSKITIIDSPKSKYMHINDENKLIEAIEKCLDQEDNCGLQNI